MNPTMSTNIILLVALFALLGGLASAILVWLNQKPRPPFDLGSFAASFIISLAAAFGIAEAFNYASITYVVLACFGAFISGMGGNTLISNVAAMAIKKVSPPTTSTGYASVTLTQFIPGQFYRRI